MGSRALVGSMRMARFFLALAVQACASDPKGNPTADSADAATEGVVSDAEDATAAVPGIFRICGVSGANASCEGVAAYASCIAADCGEILTRCFGAGYATDDFTGGACAEYAACATTLDDPCANACAASDGCQSCLADLAGCFQASACATPLCDVAGAEDAGGLEAGPPPGITGTCADLQACCDALEGTDRDVCAQTLADAQAAQGEPDCAVVFSTYRAAGICQ